MKFLRSGDTPEEPMLETNEKEVSWEKFAEVRKDGTMVHFVYPMPMVLRLLRLENEAGMEEIGAWVSKVPPKLK